ncbi:lamin tail domain-containing protein [Streptomyces sp. NPDC003753]
MRTVLPVLVAAGCAAVVAVPSQAQAASAIQIYKIYYDSPGADRGGNTSLNAEYVEVKNTGRSAIDLRGYKVKDASNHWYTFPAYKIGAGKTVKVHTGKGTTSAGNLYQGRSWYVWNNDKDTATLYKSGGAFADSCSYNNSRVDYKMC